MRPVTESQSSQSDVVGATVTVHVEVQSPPPVLTLSSPNVSGIGRRPCVPFIAGVGLAGRWLVHKPAAVYALTTAEVTAAALRNPVSVAADREEDSVTHDGRAEACHVAGERRLGRGGGGGSDHRQAEVTLVGATG